MIFVVAAMFLIPLVVEAGNPLEFHVTSRLQIPADDGQQGVATDGEFIYVQNTQQLFKYDLHGKTIASHLQAILWPRLFQVF